MTENLYCLYDKVADRYTHFMLATSDGMYVRELVAHRIAFPLNFRDTVPVCLGKFEHGHMFSLDGQSIGFRKLSWDAWKAPESTAALLAPLGLPPEETARIAREKIEKQITELRKKNETVPDSLLEEYNLITKR